MIRISKEEMINSSIKATGEIYDNIISKEGIKLSDIDYNTTTLVIVDMINGFIREGLLMSNRVEDIVGSITRIQKEFLDKGADIISFVDSHNEGAKEFNSYPPHCIKGSSESDIISEIKSIGGYKLIEKNSTNGFLEDGFINYINENEHIKNYIVVGCCTDICVMQLCLSMKTYFNNKNMDRNITVPVSCCETFDLFSHNGDFVDLLGIQLMEWAGINIVKSID